MGLVPGSKKGDPQLAGLELQQPIGKTIVPFSANEQRRLHIMEGEEIDNEPHNISLYVST